MDINLGNLNLTENQIANIGVNPAPQPFLNFGVSGNGNVLTTASREPTQQETDAVIDFLQSLPDVVDQSVLAFRFNVDLMAAGLAQTFDIPTQIELESSFAVIQGYAQAHAFTGEKSVKAYMDGLVSANKMTPQQYEIVRQIILSQGVEIGAIA